jgi:hypothetical protein
MGIGTRNGFGIGNDAVVQKYQGTTRYTTTGINDNIFNDPTLNWYEQTHLTYDEVLLWRIYISDNGLQDDLNFLPTGVQQEINDGFFRTEEFQSSWWYQSDQYVALYNGYQAFLLTI